MIFNYVTTLPLWFGRIARASFMKTLTEKNKETMKEKNIVLEWTPIEGSAASALDNFVFTDRKEVRR